MRMSHLFCVDRIEGDYAVLVDEDGVTSVVFSSELPGARAGKVYRKDGEIYFEDIITEQELRERVSALQNHLRQPK